MKLAVLDITGKDTGRKVELSKDVDASKMKLDEAKALIEKKTPKKKTKAKAKPKAKK